MAHSAFFCRNERKGITQRSQLAAMGKPAVTNQSAENILLNLRIFAVNNLYIRRKDKNIIMVAKYIYHNENWTNFTWDDKVFNVIFGEVRSLQGKIIGQMNTLGFSLKE